MKAGEGDRKYMEVVNYRRALPLLARVLGAFARVLSHPLARLALCLPVARATARLTVDMLRACFPRGVDPLYLYASPFRALWRVYQWQWRWARRLVRACARVARRAVEGYDGCLAAATRWCARCGLVGDL